MGNIILFAILGAVFYYIFKSYKTYASEYSQAAFKNMKITKETLEHSDLGLFVALVAKVAKADGKVDALEAELVGIMFDDISAVFPEPQKTKDILKQIFNEQKERYDNLEQIAATLGKAIKRDKAKQHQFIGFLIQLAFVDGEVSKSEEDVLSTIAESFEIDPNLYHAIFDQFEKIIKNIHPKANIQDAYKLLGVNESDDMDAIKKAYRKLIREYHPDIIKSQGKDEEYMKEATEKTQEINQAYEMIKNAKK
ncbi:TerB family tellurite resistance protein [bacterium]|nr:TerB family tellurite resistance protein [bacterium]MBU1993883.1 TerB family tellurite resistance protein [bacterium]